MPVRCRYRAGAVAAALCAATLAAHPTICARVALATGHCGWPPRAAGHARARTPPPSLRTLRGGGDGSGTGAKGGFPTLTATDGEVLAVESLCMNCEEQGTTRILPTTIPRFGQVVIMAFECAVCNYTSNTVQNAAEIKPLGVQYMLRFSPAPLKSLRAHLILKKLTPRFLRAGTLTPGCWLNSVAKPDDLDRQVIKSQHATIRLPELDFEIPPLTQAGSLSTVEGVLMQAASGLESMQPQRREVDAPTAEKIQSVIDELKNLAAGARPFVLTLDDPSGQSLIEATAAGSQDFALTTRSYTRSVEQDADLGVAFADTAGEEGSSRHHTEATSQDAPAPTDGHLSTLGGGGSRWVPNKAVNFGAREGAAEALDGLYAAASSSEVEVFRLACPSCRAEGEEERMYPTRIPHFGQVIIMAFTCGQCGYRSNEVCIHMIYV